MNDEHSALRQYDFEPQGVSLSAADVQQQKFPLKLRGYDTQDVDAFLDVVAREMERQLNENSRLREELKELQRTIDAYRLREKSLDVALTDLQKMADRMKNGASSQSVRMLAEAARIVGDGQKKISEAYERLNTCRGQSRAGTRLQLEEIRSEIAGIGHALASEGDHACDEITLLKHGELQFQCALKALLDTHLKLIEQDDDQC